MLQARRIPTLKRLFSLPQSRLSDLPDAFHLMKTHRQELWFHAKKRREMFNITERVWAAVAESAVSEGLVLVNVRPACSSTTMRAAWNAGWKSSPRKSPMRNTSTMAARTHHHGLGGGRLGSSTLGLGSNELDGKRDKRVLVKIVGE